MKCDSLVVLIITALRKSLLWILLLAAEPEQPSLQELCRTTVRRVIRTNIYKTHPELGKVHKRPKKPKKKPSKGTFGSNMNIVPLMGMGMMILHQFDRDDSITDSEDEDRDIRGVDHEMDEVDDRSHGVEDNNDVVEAAFSTDEEDEVEKKKCDTKDPESAGAESKLSVKCDNGRKKDVLFVGSQTKEKVEAVAKGDPESDYGSDEEGKCQEAINSVANATGSETERNARESVSRIDEIIANVMASCSPRSATDHFDHLSPPDTHWSDSDEDTEDSKKYDVEEFIKFGAKEKSLEPPRKARYSSNTSVDTSTTSGIGSFVEDHLDEEMGRSDSAKTSPGWSHSEPEPGSSKSGLHTMEVDDNVIEETESEKEDEYKEDEDFPKITLSQCMKEAIEGLPLPSAMKMYLKYYRE